MLKWSLSAASALTGWLGFGGQHLSIVAIERHCRLAAVERTGRVHELEFAEQLVDDVLGRGARHAAHHALAVAEHVARLSMTNT